MKWDSKPYRASAHNRTTAIGITMTISIAHLQNNTITLANEVRKCMLEYCLTLTCSGPMYNTCNWSMFIQSAVESLKASVWQNLVLVWLLGRNCSRVCMSLILCTWNAYQRAAGQTDPWSWSSSQESGHPMICTDDPLEGSPVRSWHTKQRCNTSAERHTRRIPAVLPAVESLAVPSSLLRWCW